MLKNTTAQKWTKDTGVQKDAENNVTAFSQTITKKTKYLNVKNAKKNSTEKKYMSTTTQKSA